VIELGHGELLLGGDGQAQLFELPHGGGVTELGRGELRQHDGHVHVDYILV